MLVRTALTVDIMREGWASPLADLLGLILGFRNMGFVLESTRVAGRQKNQQPIEPRHVESTVHVSPITRNVLDAQFGSSRSMLL